MRLSATDSAGLPTADWVDEFLLKGPAQQICLRLSEPVDRATLRRLVIERQSRLVEAGLRAGGAAALRLPPSLAYLVDLLAVWRTGAQAVLLDHRLTDYEVDQALRRLAPQVLIRARRTTGAALQVFFDVEEEIVRLGADPAGSQHAVIQLSSGSTGPAKVIGRGAADLVAEVRRYTGIDGVPAPGERVILLPSVVHVLGLVGGLLFGLHTGVELQPPSRLSGEAILHAVSAHDTPATVLGVPFHVGLLTSTDQTRRLGQLRRMTIGGEPVPAVTASTFEDRFGVPLGTMYGMTETGVIATDLHGRHRPGVMPAPGMQIREVAGELWVSCPASPYVGDSENPRWSDGWLRTRDAGLVDPDSGLVTVRGRLDSQVSVGGLKIDLTEVEWAITALPGVAAAVVVHDGEITAYVQPVGDMTVDGFNQTLGERLARYKMPRRVRILDQLPRTTTGKVVRDPSVLRQAVGAASPGRSASR